MGKKKKAKNSKSNTTPRVSGVYNWACVRDQPTEDIYLSKMKKKELIAHISETLQPLLEEKRTRIGNLETEIDCLQAKVYNMDKRLNEKSNQVDRLICKLDLSTQANVTLAHLCQELD